MTKSINSYNFYYEFSDIKQPVIEFLRTGSEYSREGVIGINEIIFILEGNCKMNCDIYPPMTISKNEFIFLPSGCNFDASAPKDTKVIIFRLDPLQKVYGSYSVDELYYESLEQEFPEEACKLGINKVMDHYLEGISYYLESGIKFPIFYEIKIKELLLIFDAYYQKQELCHFFKPILNNDFVFASSILNNWEKARNAKELAELCSYTETAFFKKFKKVFGTTPYKWLNERKSAKVLYSIVNTDKPLKLIAEENDFNSQQQFNDYCIRNFNQTPGNIRGK